MNLNYRILDCDIFESYMALEGWDNFPYLKTCTDKYGAMSFLLQDNSYMIFDFTPSTDFLKAICIYQMYGDTLVIKLFEVHKNFRGKGVGTSAIERLIFETGAKYIELDAKDDDAAKFWESLGMKQVDYQHYVI